MGLRCAAWCHGQAHLSLRCGSGGEEMVGARWRLVLCVGAALLVEAGSPATVDIMPMLMELKFEPHHRNFVRNLYENQMLVRTSGVLLGFARRAPRRQDRTRLN